MIIERGVVVVEDQEWKNRKKILSKVFNYDFISSQIPNMAMIADKVFDKFEEKYWNQHPEKR
jgi:cytochrome P450